MGNDDVQAGGSSAKAGFWPSSLTSCYNIVTLHGLEEHEGQRDAA